MLPRANATLIGPAVNCLTVVSVDNLAIRSDRADADQAAMLYLAELANASMEARRDELAAMFGDVPQGAALQGEVFDLGNKASREGVSPPAQL